MCQGSDYQTNVKSDIDSHKTSAHETENQIKCGDCDQSFIEGTNYREHMKTHEIKMSPKKNETNERNSVETETLLNVSETDEEKQEVTLEESQQVFNCIMCAWTFSTLQDLDSHMEISHMKILKNDASKVAIRADIEEPPKTKSFPQKVQRFWPIFELQSKSKKANIHSIRSKSGPKEENIILTEKIDTCTKCWQCDFIGDKTELRKHLELKHTIRLKCDKCSNEYPDVKALDEHVRSNHSEQELNEPFPCEMCGLCFSNFSLLQEHAVTYHRATKMEDCHYCDQTYPDGDQLKSHMMKEHEEIVILCTMAQQVNDITDKFGGITDILTKLLDKQNAMEQELFILRNVQTEMVGNIKKKPRQPDDILVEKENEKQDQNSETQHTVKPESYKSRASVKEAEDVTKKECSYQMSNILIVGDSHLQNLETKVLEEASKTVVEKATAYTTDEDVDAKFPKKNFLKVVPEKLSQKSFDTLILQGGCNEISNLNVYSGQRENFKIWQEKVKMSRTKMFQLAKSSLENNPSLKKVIILKSLPRYDPKKSDPESIKAQLNQFGNTLYNTLWMEDGCPSNILIADQYMECQGPLRQKRFGNPGYRNQDGKPWDGIHMRGRLASRHYTNSLVRILAALSPSGGATESEDYHRTCPQARYQARQQGGDYQYQYQPSRRGFRSNYRQGYHNTPHTSQGFDDYNVRVSNRFSHLGNFQWGEI